MPRTSGAADWLGRITGRPLALAVEVGFLLRIIAADLVEWRVQQAGSNRVCLLPDAEYYWKLAQTIREGDLFQIIDFGDIPHFALRTPGYPLFLAVCRAVTGDRPIGARLIQAALGAACVWLVFRLCRATLGDNEWGRAPLIAAAITAVHPYFIVMSALLLSEALFTPLLLAFLWTLAVIWNRETVRPILVPAIGAGALAGAAVLTRPSCLLFFPAAFAAWLLSRAFARKTLQPAFIASLAASAAFAAVMAPWWIRNHRIYGEFVPTALWMGASLYDGLNPSATGASDMRFLEAPDIWPLDERDQDDLLRRRAFAFARENPLRTLELAVVKLGRYWSPWPNAEGVRSVWLTLAAGLAMTPLLGLTAFGLWSLRGDARAWVLLAGPILYFALLHTVFVSSMRYRTPGEVPAMGLTAVGLLHLAGARPPKAQTA
ncbi:ArnT family glycosyltransferase [Paludisphaera rhizosphaerae]|uniref:ArnT family glycosyltransferase n=1 Tax=Paludisphaera rhizosphaerae TaxID=2711216 RepID=UPI0013EE3800|nr:glycosyltransferase family 39 protein [Paludisphaera rhizosphaerae]